MPRKYYDIKASKKDTDLYLYGFIGNSVWDDINPKELIDSISGINGGVIRVHINSEGGSVYGGQAIYNALKNHDSEVEVYIEGLAASMASIIALAGDRVYMADNALYMIHDPWTWTEGSADDLRKTAQQLDKAKETLINVYERKTEKDREEIAELMSQETWFTAQEAKEHGFVDEIIEEIDMAASLKQIDRDNLKKANLPDNVKAILEKGSINQPDDGDIKEVHAMPTKAEQQKAPENSGKNEAVAQVDIKAKQQEAAKAALKAEASRRDAVKAVFQPFQGQHDDLMAQCLDDMEVSEAKAQQMLLAKLSAKKTESLGQPVKVLEDESEKRRKGFTAAMLGRAGLVKDQESNEFRGFSMAEMARYTLEKAGVNTRNMHKMEMVGAAFTHTSSDFPNILKDVVNKTMLKGWDEAPETFEAWTSDGILTDFREATRAGINTFPALDAVPDGGEYKYGTVGDRGEVIQLATYGKLVSLTRQTIINDDLNAFTKIPLSMGRAARRTIGNLAYAVLTSNPLMADGVALFAGGHNNLGSAGALATGTVDELRALMAKQTDGNATALGITPAYLVVPEALRGQAIITVESETEIAASQNNSRRPNSVRNIAEVISDARLDAASATAYYLIANPALFDTVEVAYLDGVKVPYLEQKDGWSVDGSSFKVRIDAGVKALDYRTMAKNAGA